MTATAPPTLTPTAESEALAGLDADIARLTADIAALRVRLDNPQGWQQEISDSLALVETQMAQLVAERARLRLIATTMWTA